MNSSEIFRQLSKGLRFPKQTNPIFNCKDTKNGSDVKNNKVEIKEGTLLVKSEEQNFINHQSDDDITILNAFGTDTKKRGKKRKLESEDEIKRKKQILESEELNHYRNVNKIKVKGKGIPAPARTFMDLKIDSDIQENLFKAGFCAPTLIQQQAVPVIMKGQNLLALAPTGSGKTAAYLLPIIHKLRKHKKHGIRTLILCPTRELVKQIKNECLRISDGRKLRIFTIGNKKKSIAEFSSESKQNYDLLITTPGRLCLLLDQENSTLDLKTVEQIVVDEADKLFESGNCGFRKQLKKILEACNNENRKIAMFGATSRSSVSKWFFKSVKNVVQVNIGRRNIASLDVDQKLRFVGDDKDKLYALRDIIRKGIAPPVLIFVQTKDKARFLFKELLYDGIYVDAIHADRTEEERANTVRAFQNKKIWVLICTELMARGIDFKNVNLVINFDFPPSLSSYIHRVGRAGRAGQKGASVSFYNTEDVESIRNSRNLNNLALKMVNTRRKIEEGEMRQIPFYVPCNCKIHRSIQPTMSIGLLERKVYEKKEEVDISQYVMKGAKFRPFEEPICGAKSKRIAHKLVASGCEVPENLIENRIERKRRALKAKKEKAKIEAKNAVQGNKLDKTNSKKINKSRVLVNKAENNKKLDKKRTNKKVADKLKKKMSTEE